jgi:hypothetical protein
MIMSFSKIVGKTASKGQITVPKECDNILDKYKYCPISDSVAITYRLQNGAEIPGRLYQSANNTTTYYQFYIPDAKDKIIFENQIGYHRAISIDFNIKTHCLRVSPLEIE